jgi:hypothetical protein
MAFSLVVFGLALTLQAVEVPPPSQGCALPKGLGEALQQRFGSARVLKPADLFEDERALFRKEHPNGCPGMARGQFFGPGQRPAIALVLLDVEPKKNLRLVVARPALASWTLVEIEELDAGTTAVVGLKGPGTYVDHATPPMTLSSTHDVVTLTGYESWERVYIWNGRKFERLQTSE